MEVRVVLGLCLLIGLSLGAALIATSQAGDQPFAGAGVRRAAVRPLRVLRAGPPPDRFRRRADPADHGAAGVPRTPRDARLARDRRDPRRDGRRVSPAAQRPVLHPDGPRRQLDEQSGMAGRATATRRRPVEHRSGRSPAGLITRSSRSATSWCWWCRSPRCSRRKCLAPSPSAMRWTTPWRRNSQQVTHCEVNLVAGDHLSGTSLVAKDGRSSPGSAGGRPASCRRERHPRPAIDCRPPIRDRCLPAVAGRAPRHRIGCSCCRTGSRRSGSSTSSATASFAPAA